MRAPAAVSPLASAVPRPPRPTHTSESASLATVPRTDSGLTIVNAAAAPATALVRMNSRLLTFFFRSMSISPLTPFRFRTVIESKTHTLYQCLRGVARLFDRRGNDNLPKRDLTVVPLQEERTRFRFSAAQRATGN